MLIGRLFSATGEYLGDVYSGDGGGGVIGILLLTVALLFFPLFAIAVVLSAVQQFDTYFALLSKHFILYVFIAVFLISNIFINKAISASDNSGIGKFFTGVCVTFAETAFAAVAFAITFSGHIYTITNTNLSSTFWYKITYGADSLLLALMIAVATMLVAWIISILIFFDIGSGPNKVIAEIIMVALAVVSIVYLKNTADSRVAERKAAVDTYVTQELEKAENIDDRDYDAKREAINDLLEVVYSYDKDNEDLQNQLKGMLDDIEAAENEYVESGQKEIDDIKNLDTMDLCDEKYVVDYTKINHFSLDFDKHKEVLSVHSWEAKDGYVEYRLHEGFNTVSGNITLYPNHEDSVYENTYIVIYGDGKKLYKSPKISAHCNIDFNVDVSGVDKLRVEFKTDSKFSYLSDKVVSYRISNFAAE